MLRAVAPGPQVVVCSTCGPGGDPGGARLGLALRRMRDADPAFAGIGIEDMACLFACSRACAVHIRAPGKIGYVLNGFAPDAASARAILGYALAHAASAHGEVDYALWPEGVKGHFIARIPPEACVID